MTRNIHREVHENLDRGDPERLAFTQRALGLLPDLHEPRILDVGCGKGEPTLELARLTGGVIVGVDIDLASLVELSSRASERGLADRVQVMNCSVHDMTFPDESFDIIWSEASIHITGYETGLADWRRFLKRRGFLVVHEMAWLHPDPPTELVDHWQQLYPGIRTVPEYVAEVPDHGYRTVGHFTLPEDFWWHHYYGPLETRIAELRQKYGGNRELIEHLEREQREVDLYKKFPRWYGSAYLIMART